MIKANMTIRIQQLSMHLISKLAALALFFAPLTLAVPTENASGLTGNPDDLACKNGTYRCKYWAGHRSNIEVCSGGRWVLSAACTAECQEVNHTPYCI